jgi:kynurenine formamidase
MTPSIRGRRTPFILQEEFESRDRARSEKSASVFFSLHIATHADLPFALYWDAIEFLGEVLPEKMKEKMRTLTKKRDKMMKKYYMPHVYPCTVLDLTSKFKLVNAIIEASQQDVVKKETLDIGEEAYRHLHKMLEISEKNLSPLSGKVEGNIVLFRTNWEAFRMADLYSPNWEAWSAYLTHPYLGKEGTAFLLDQKVEGVGSDAPNIEDPLYYISHVGSYQASLIRKLAKEVDLLPYRPVHTLFLLENKWLLEGVANTRNIPCETDGSCQGELLVCPFPIGSEERLETKIDDAMPVTLYYLPTQT